MDKPLLSICIPTYNRSQYLKKCLEAIVRQDGFQYVEVIISDNCSTDDTEAIGRGYEKQYNNIRYFRNEENVIDMNYPLVFQRATGILRKLTNDTVIYRPGAIRYMLDAVKENAAEKPQIYFLSQGKLTEDRKKITSLNDYITSLGHNITWIRSMAIWEDDCDDLGVLVTKAESRMAQVPFLLDNFEKHHGAVIYDREIMDSLDVQKKNLSYGLYKVFYETFLGFIKPYVDEGKVSSTAYESLRKDLLLNFFCQWIINIELYADKYIFSEENLRKLVDDAYRNETYFSDYEKRLNILRIQAKIKREIKTILKRD